MRPRPDDARAWSSIQTGQLAKRRICPILSPQAFNLQMGRKAAVELMGNYFLPMGSAFPFGTASTGFAVAIMTLSRYRRVRNDQPLSL